jgi:glutaredoxin 3
MKIYVCKRINVVKVVIYTKANCSYCEQAKSLLIKKNIAYSELYISEPDILDQLKDLVSGVKTVPQIFIDGAHIGGYTELVGYLR